jgi:hypothetical protein
MRGVSTVLLFFVLSGVPSAQERLGPGRGFPDRPPGPGIDILGIQPLEMSAPVMGAPFSAETVTELVQELVDGNRMEQRMVGSVARDGLGRVRRELPLGVAGGFRIVTITLPEEGVQYRLDHQNKIAWRLRMPPVRPDRPGGLPRRPLLDGMTTEPLANSSWEGLKTEGTRTTLVIPANSIGNQRDIDVISERWYSPELQLVVQTYRSDPRTGKSSYKLVKLVRGEPDARLFEIPSGYTIRDERPFGPPPPPGVGHLEQDPLHHL